MFEIDLLKGKARPYKPSPKRVVLIGALLAIPVIATLVYAAGIQSDRARLATMRRITNEHQTRLADYAGDMEFLTGLRRQIDTVSVSLSDIGQALRYRVITSDILAAIAQELPATVVLREMNVRRTGKRERKTDEAGNARFETTVQRGLSLTLCGDEYRDCDAAVQQYIERLKAAEAIAPMLVDIRTASRQQQVLDGREATVYQLELTFKDQR